MTDEQRMVPGKGSYGEPHLRPPTLAALSLTQDPVGQPFGVLSFLPYSQTLVPPPSPLCRFSVSKRSPRCSSTTVGLRSLSRDISSGFSDSLFFPSALFNSLVRRLGRSSGTYLQEAGPGGSGHQLSRRGAVFLVARQAVSKPG